MTEQTGDNANAESTDQNAGQQVPQNEAEQPGDATPTDGGTPTGTPEQTTTQTTTTTETTAGTEEAPQQQ